MNDLFVRALTGAVYAGLSIGAAWAGREATFVLFLPVCMLAATEFHRLARPADGRPLTSALLAGTAYCALGALALFGYWRPPHAFLVIAVLFVGAMVAGLRQGPQRGVRDTGGVLALLALIALPLSTLTHLAAIGPWALAGFLFMLWANDTGAYLVGSLAGRTRLLPVISPGKTVEGLIGGGLAALGVAWAVSQADTGIATRTWMLSGAGVVVTATVGDLLESAWKRAAGVKDSGTILPGHGGILDRFDGMLLAAPVHWAVLVLGGAPA